ncbi:hypothetical protein V8E54_003575 [Elaphomyces granulatus]
MVFWVVARGTRLSQVIFLRQSQLEGFGVEILRHQTKLLSLDLDTHIAAPVVTQSDLSQQRKRRRVQAEHTGDDPLQDVHDFVLHYTSLSRRDTSWAKELLQVARPEMEQRRRRRSQQYMPGT